MTSLNLGDRDAAAALLDRTEALRLRADWVTHWCLWEEAAVRTPEKMRARYPALSRGAERGAAAHLRTQAGKRLDALRAIWGVADADSLRTMSIVIFLSRQLRRILLPPPEPSRHGSSFLSRWDDGIPTRLPWAVTDLSIVSSGRALLRIQRVDPGDGRPGSGPRTVGLLWRATGWYALQRGWLIPEKGEELSAPDPQPHGTFWLRSRLAAGEA